MGNMFFMILYPGKSYTIVRFFRKHVDHLSHELTFPHPACITCLHCHCSCQASVLRSPPLVWPPNPVFLLQQESWFFRCTLVVVTSLHKTFQLLPTAFRFMSNSFPWLPRSSGSAYPWALLPAPRVCVALRLLRLLLLFPSLWSSVQSLLIRCSPASPPPRSSLESGSEMLQKGGLP